MESRGEDRLDLDVRSFVYAHFVERGLPPTAERAADGIGVGPGEARAAYERLDGRHALFLDPETRNVRMAFPFSGVPTPFRVSANGRSYWANCAWDMLGIPEALHADASIEAEYAEDRSPARLSVEDGALRSSGGFVHVPLPVRRWYDDLIFTWANILLFRSEGAIDGWCGRTGLPRGESLTLERTWELSGAWYGDRLSPDFQGRTVQDAEEIFGRLGLTGTFWRP